MEHKMVNARITNFWKDTTKSANSLPNNSCQI